MLANSLTKKGERWQIDNYYRGNGCWKLVHGERAMHATNNRRVGIGTFEAANVAVDGSQASGSDASDGAVRP